MQGMRETDQLDPDARQEEDAGGHGNGAICGGQEWHGDLRPEEQPRRSGNRPVSEGSQCVKALIACEESQAVCKAFRERGHEAFSCDIQECSGGHPEWHIQGDALALINGDCDFVTCGGVNTR